jgi:hypothetical protein
MLLIVYLFNREIVYSFGRDHKGRAFRSARHFATIPHAVIGLRDALAPIVAEILFFAL